VTQVMHRCSICNMRTRN